MFFQDPIPLNQNMFNENLPRDHQHQGYYSSLLNDFNSQLGRNGFTQPESSRNNFRQPHNQNPAEITFGNHTTRIQQK